MLKNKKKLVLIIVIVLAVSLTLILSYFPFTFSEKITDSGWDGVVATSFSGGNGEEDNPYVISSAGELAYLKELLEGEDAPLYIDKNYIITSSFNYGGYDLTINNAEAFKGSIDGQGSTISNFRVDKHIFNSIENSSFKNINFKKAKYVLTTGSGAFLSNESKESTLENIVVNVNVVNDSSFGGLIYKDEKSTLENIVLYENIESSTNDYSVLIYEATETTIKDVLVKRDTYDLIKVDNASLENVSYFKIVGDKISLEDADSINEYKNEDYKIVVSGENFLIKSTAPVRALRSAPRFTSLVFEEHDTEVTSDTVYINDLEADYNYYMGLNYASSTNGTLPTLDNKHVYGDNNLVKVMISYSSVGDNLTGHIGYDSNERQTKMVYYKYLPVVNGKVDITLIDNPFTYRPNNKGFNGWISDTTGVTLSLDRTLYERHATVDATSNGEGGYNDIALSFHASWVEAKIANVTSSGWASVFSEFDSPGLVEIETSRYVCDPYDMSGYYHRYTAGFYERYTGYDSNGNYVNNQRCWSSSCTYYTEINGEYYDENQTYYYWTGNSFAQVNPNSLNINCYTEMIISPDQDMAGYYVNRTFSRGASYTGYYNLSGNMVSGTCNSSSCTYYEFLQSFDENGDSYEIEDGKTYYYLATRDTNIAYLAGNVSGTWGSSYTKPFTFTGLLNGTRSSYTWNVNNTNVNIYNDTTIENMIINSNKAYSNADPSLSSTTSGGWYGTTTYYANVVANYHNLKIGRGLRRSGSNTNFDSFVGGNESTGSSSSNTKYNLIIESGYYSSTSITEAPARQSSDTLYIQANAVYGNDYDRVKNNNDNLVVSNCAAGSWAGKIYSSRESAVSLTVKSGSFGQGKYDMYAGIYVGGLSSGSWNAARSAKIEGGYIYNLIGGPLTASNRSTKNDTYIYQTGGKIDVIVAGAGRSATYGNRIVSLTGGQVNYSVFGGSNGSGTDATDGDGTLNGTSYIYVGGKSTVGDNTLVNNSNTLWGAEAGSVFGIGNGKSGSSGIGSNDSSNIIVDGEALVRRNVYGGGNYGATGLSGSVSNTTTNIKVIGGTVHGDVYGGGNQNGAGDSSTSATINLTLAGGTVDGNMYGGSNISGTIYGAVNLNANSGTVDKNIYGGGKGNNTYVRTNVNVTVAGATINGNVYGGSAFGTINSTSSSGSSYGNTTVTVNSGTIRGSVFGGGQGSNTYTPHVQGTITTTINGGSITSVYGGHDQAGNHANTNHVNLNGGTIENAFGGGNKSSVTTTNVHLNGADVNYIYGGSNEQGSVSTANVLIENGEVSYVYGGNNIGGSCSTANVTVDGDATIQTAVFGGGNKVNVGTSNVSLESVGTAIPNVFGGGNEASVTTAIINSSGASITNLYGGSNTTGTVNNSTINQNNGSVTNMYGGNNHGGTTNNVTINYNSGTSTNVFGGGNEATSSVATINLINGNITNVFGGGNQAGLTNTTINVGNNTNTNNLNITNVYGGSNENGVVTNPTIIINKGTIANVYGGNNLGGTTSASNITMNNGTITGTLYGGGNRAVVTGNVNVTLNAGNIGTVFGAGNLANVNQNVSLNCKNISVTNSIYGGGNEAEVLGNTTVNLSGTSASSVYAGGNGRTAVVRGNTTINVGKNTTVGSTSSTGVAGSVFGSGNQAATGAYETNNSKSIVNILGGSIYGNVYGGANTSVVYGQAEIKIGKNAVNDSTILNNVDYSNIYIRGTVFGGGETNEAGSETFNYDSISVTDGIRMTIDASDYNSFIIEGSIFGSGNASNTPADKESTVTIRNYGTLENPEFNLSIQRVKKLIINNSVIELSGVRDSTDDYHPTDLFSLNRIKSMEIRNNTVLFLRRGTNYLEEVKSLDNNGNKATVNINNGVVTKNTDNRIYIQEGKHINVAHDGSATDYANVYGMSFFGMYTISATGRINMKMFDPEITNGTTASWADIPTAGSYVLAKHETNHNTKVDGFYSNFFDEENMVYNVDYIEPTPAASTYYYWMVGENVIEYTVNLVASKYSTLGTVELSLRGLDKPNTSFQLLGFDYSALADNVTLIDKSQIRGIASSTDIANSTFGLSMTSSNKGWLNWGSTSFYSNEQTPYGGTTYYIGDNSNEAPSLLFYLNHFKNLTETRDMGTVAIQLMAITKIDDINSQLQRIVITVNLSTAIYTTSEYEGTMTPGKKYELFTSTTTKITDDSSLSAYYSLYSHGNNLYRTGYKHVLTSNYALPTGTKLTLIDLSLTTPRYYYYEVTSSDEAAFQQELSRYNEVSYPLSKFKLMDTVSNNNYSDSTMNSLYYNGEDTLEEFIVQIDFANANINSNVYDRYLYPELQDSSGNLIIGALAIQRDNLKFSLYNDAASLIEVNASVDNNTFYNGSKAPIYVESSLLTEEESSDIIYDTKYYEDYMGLVIYLTHEVNNGSSTSIEKVSGNILLGTYFTINGVNYYPDATGETRLKYADRIGNISSQISFNLEGANIPTGNYTLNIAMFGSSDGMHYPSDTSKISAVKEIPIRIVQSNYGLKAAIDDTSMIIVNTTDEEARYLTGKVNYSSYLADPNIRVRLYRRNYETTYSTDYELVDLKDYIQDNLTLSNIENCYILFRTPTEEKNFLLTLKEERLLTGTYRMDFELYDANSFIGKHELYFVIKDKYYE